MEKSNRFVESVELLEPRIVTFISDRELYVLRDAVTHKALNVSFTEEGLKWTTHNDNGKILFYKNGSIKRDIGVHNGKVYGKLSIVSSDNKPLKESNKVYIEKFIPRNHKIRGNQLAEYIWVRKALRLLNLGAGSFEA